VSIRNVLDAPGIDRAGAVPTNLKDLIEGPTPEPSGVVRVRELQEAGYAYIRP
jgi:intracellular sulfur oxidation DsrE/DsrF family protein